MISNTEQLWEDLHTSIRGYVRRRVRNPADVDDVVQRVFLQVHRGLPALRQADRAHVWVYRAARHAVADYYRGPEHRRELPSGSLADVADASDTEIEQAGEDDRSALQNFAACVRHLMQTLPAPDLEALTLVDLEGLSQTEAAKRLGLSVPGMKSRVQRARRRFKAVVEDCCRVYLDQRGAIVGYERRGMTGCARCKDENNEKNELG